MTLLPQLKHCCFDDPGANCARLEAVTVDFGGGESEGGGILNEGLGRRLDGKRPLGSFNSRNGPCEVGGHEEEGDRRRVS